MSEQQCELDSKYERNNGVMQKVLNGVRQKIFVITKKD